MLYGIVVWYRCVFNDVFNVTIYYRMLLYKIYDFDVKFNYSDINVYFVQTRMQALISTLQGDIFRVYESLRNPVPTKNITQKRCFLQNHKNTEKEIFAFWVITFESNKIFTCLAPQNDHLILSFVKDNYSYTVCAPL